MSDMEFVSFQSIPRLSREVIITEKIDGTNAQVFVAGTGRIYAGSRTRWLTPDNDNFGFAAWVKEHENELRALGPGHHFGEWWGKGIQRGYGLDERRFSLFNVSRWSDEAGQRPPICHVVPVLMRAVFTEIDWSDVMLALTAAGSRAAPGFPFPEGIVVYHPQGNVLFKKTFKNDDKGKSYGS